jgi:regulator of sigma D
VDKDVYIDFIKDKVTLENIIDFSSKNKISIYDLLTEWQQAENRSTSKDTTIHSTPTQKTTQITSEENLQQDKISIQEKSETTNSDNFVSVLKFIEKEFHPNPVRDETELENQLVQFLRSKYGSAVQEQVPTPYGKIDVVLFNKYALELKLATNKNNLRDMVGQLRDYRKVYPNLAAIILRINIDYNDINYYTNEYAKDGIKSVVIEGQLRSGRKRGGRGIHIKL